MVIIKMINKIYIIVSLIFSLILFQSCDDEWIFDIPGCMDPDALNYDSNATSDNESCNYYVMQTIDIDAEQYYYDGWDYFSFSLGNVVDMSGLDPSQSMEWDIAFSRNNIITNGGGSGSGGVCAIINDTDTWTNDSFGIAQEITEGDCQVDELIQGNEEEPPGCYCNSPVCGGHGFKSCVKNPALDQWGYFEGTDFIVNNYQFFVKDVDGNYVKLWLMKYKNTDGKAGHIRLAYEILQ